MTKDEMNSLVDNMSDEEKDMMFKMMVGPIGFEEFRKQQAPFPPSTQFRYRSKS